MPRPRLGKRITQALAESPSEGLLCARQTGKTTLTVKLAKQMRTILYFGLETQAGRALSHRA